MYCETCGAKINEEDKFCWNCGIEFTDDIIIQAIDPKDINKNIKIETADIKIMPNYCTLCGNHLDKRDIIYK